MTRRTRIRALGRTELRRRWRRAKDNPAQAIGLAILAMFAIPVSLAAIGGLYVFGSEVAGGGVGEPLRWARTGLVYGWLGVAAFGGYRAYATALDPDHLDGLLTTVSHGTVLAGILYAEGVFWALATAVVGGLGAAAFAVGARAPLAFPTALLAVVLVVASALLAGVAVALAIRNTGVRSKLLTRLRTALVTLVALAYFWVVFTGAFDSVLTPLSDLLAPTPIGWFGDLALLGLGVETSPLRAAGAAAFGLAVVAASVPALDRLAGWLWYADGVAVEHVEAASVGSDRESRLAGLVGRPLAGVARVDWTRARRAPLSQSYVVYPLFLLVNPAIEAVQTGSVGTLLVLSALLSGAWVAGALFTLNVLGNEGAALPVTVLGPSPGRALVGGHVVASMVPAVPATVLATVALGALAGYSLALVGTLALAAVVLAVAAPPIATGIGAAMPRHDAVKVSRSRTAVVPSMLAFAVYSILVALVATPALLAHVGAVGGFVADLVGTSRAVVALGGTLVSGLLAAPTGYVSVRFAVDAVDSYALD